MIAICAAGPCWADDFHVGSLPALQWWASASGSQLAQNPDGTGTVGNGDPVGFISDLSGNGRDAVMGNAIVSGGDSYRPHLQTNLVDGNPGVLFDGSTTFSSLQSSLFNGASSLTVAFAIEAANYGPYNQYLFGSNTAPVGFVGYGSAYAGVRLANGQTISIPATQGIGLSSAAGTDTTLIMIARFQANGESDLWANGQLVGSTFNVNSSAIGQFIQSPNTKLLGNINYGSPDGAPVAPQSTATKFYFLEGMATTSALSNDQISQLYGYLSQQWPGIQEVASSPNLYWDKSANPQRAVATTINAGHIQGVAIGDNQRFIFHTAMIESYDSHWHLLNSNQAMSNGIGPPGTSLHSGDGDYAAGKVFAPLEADFGGAAQYIGVYDATKPGMPLVTYKNISTPAHEFSSLVVVPTVGARGIIYGSSFYSGSDKLWMYDYAGGDVLSPDFGRFLGTLQIPAGVTGIQGVAWKAPYFYFSAASNLAIKRVLYQNGALSNQVETLWTAPTTMQGLGFDGSNLFQVLQSGSTTEYGWTLTSPKFATLMTAGTGVWNSNGDDTYSSNWGFDGVIPNGPGSTALFGDGTINTVSAPAVQITVDGAYTVGSLNFNPSHGTSYTLAADNVPGHGLTLDSGDGSGTSVTLTSGNHAISANLVLADAGGHTFSVAPSSTLTVSGAIGESGAGRGLTLTGGGRLVLGNTNSFTGGATINSGILQTTASGALGGGPVALNAPSDGVAALYIGGNETISSLSAVAAQTGTASINLASGARLNVRQSANTTVQGTLLTLGTFTKSGSGTLELDLAPVMLLGSSLQVNDSGRLRLNATSRSASIAAGVTVQVADSATLELAGSGSALSSGGSPVNRAAVVNNSTASPGILVTGTNQFVGTIDGGGSVEVRAGSDLTASHIIQTALVIGGTAGSPATVTIAATDSSGNPLEDPNLPQSRPVSFAWPGVLSPMSSIATDQGSGAPAVLAGLSPTTSSPPPAVASSLLADSAPPNGIDGGNFPAGSLLLVPEPSSASLLMAGICAVLLLRARRSRFSR